jgi:hypothetical protein
MDSNQIHALLLLIGRIITVIFIGNVVPKQYKLLKATNYPELRKLRKRLLQASVVLLVGQFIPILIDVLGIFQIGSLNLLLVYVYSNNLTAMLAAYIMWTVYRISEQTKLNDESKENS